MSPAALETNIDTDIAIMRASAVATIRIALSVSLGSARNGKLGEVGQLVLLHAAVAAIRNATESVSEKENARQIRTPKIPTHNSNFAEKPACVVSDDFFLLFFL